MEWKKRGGKELKGKDRRRMKINRMNGSGRERKVGIRSACLLLRVTQYHGQIQFFMRPKRHYRRGRFYSIYHIYDCNDIYHKNYSLKIRVNGTKQFKSRCIIRDLTEGERNQSISVFYPNYLLFTSDFWLFPVPWCVKRSIVFCEYFISMSCMILSLILD